MRETAKYVIPERTCILNLRSQEQTKPLKATVLYDITKQHSSIHIRNKDNHGTTLLLSHWICSTKDDEVIGNSTLGIPPLKPPLCQGLTFLPSKPHWTQNEYQVCITPWSSATLYSLRRIPIIANQKFMSTILLT